MINLVRTTGFPAGGVLLTTVVAIGLDQAGALPETPQVTAILSAVLLIIGMPHGSFDLALMRRAGSDASTVRLVLLYLACAAAMYLAWRIAPVLALVAFLTMAVAHFAEDWAECGSRFIAAGMAAAIVAAPAMLHGASLAELFTVLTGDPGAAVLADLLLLVAPVAIAVAVVGIGLLWHDGRIDLALSAGCGLAAMLLLPPVPGFALFFCLVHSPLQFRSHADALGLHGIGQWRGIVVPISLGGLGVAAAIFMASNGPSLSAGVFASSFMALSVLTAPHMLVPLIADRMQHRSALPVAG